MTERGDELDHSLLGRKSEGRKKNEKEGNEGKGEGGGGVGRRCLAVLPQQDSKQVCVCLCVHSWVFMSVRERDGDMEEGAAIVPFFKQGSLGRNMNNNDSGSAACKNQTNITLTFFWLLYSSYLASAFFSISISSFLAD